MDPFDSMLRERLSRLMAIAPGVPGPTPSLPPPLTGASGVKARWRRPNDLRSAGGPSRPMASLSAGLAAGLIIVTMLGSAWLVMAPSNPKADRPMAGAAGGDGEPILWDSGHARLRADSVRILTNGQVFTASGKPQSISSDPGDRNYRTLEVIWREHGVEMRMNMYFAANAREWWATEVRVYDGNKLGDWIGWGGATDWTDRDFQRANELKCDSDPTPAAGCPEVIDLGLFRSRRGEAWTGDLDLVDGVGRANGHGRVSGDLHIKGMRLSVFDS